MLAIGTEKTNNMLAESIKKGNNNLANDIERNKVALNLQEKSASKSGLISQLWKFISCQTLKLLRLEE